MAGEFGAGGASIGAVRSLIRQSGNNGAFCYFAVAIEGEDKVRDISLRYNLFLPR